MATGVILVLFYSENSVCILCSCIIAIVYGNMSKEEFIMQRDAYRVQEDERMEQIQRLHTEKNQIFQPVKKDTDNLQAVMNTVGEAGDVMHLSQNVVETFIDRIEVFNDKRVKIHFTFEDVLAGYAE